jgi:NAD(P)-dependent dehydrogenase (short-subunit alcohol dehydrogenase family)
MRFDGKVALITGGTAGIGEATVRRLAILGAKTLFVGRNESAGRRIEDELRRDGAEAVFFKADLSGPDEVRRIVPATVKIFGRLDFAFNNAGVTGGNGAIAEQPESNFDDVFAINVKGLYIALQQELRQMVQQGWGGSIVNMASVGGMVATPGASVYVASKHAVIGLTKSAAVEYGPLGIRVSAVSPGAVETELLRNVFGDRAIEEMAAVHPIRRIGSPEDVADAVVWLFSDNSSYYTGQSLVLDGGLTAQRPFIRRTSISTRMKPARAEATPIGAIAQDDQEEIRQVIAIDKSGVGDHRNATLAIENCLASFQKRRSKAS